MGKEKPVAVSDLAEIATCQRRVYLKAKYGHRENKHTKVHRERGIEMHARADKQRHVSDKSQDKRCFVATSLYGPDAWQTQALRDFRDAQLMTNRLGRLFVRAYYRASPTLVSLSGRLPTLRRVLGVVVDFVVTRVA